MGLFKYCGESGLLVLKNLKIKATPPNEFNDPFEFSPVVCNKSPKAYAGREVKEIITGPRFFEEYRVYLPQFKNFTEFQAYARANMNWLMSFLERESPNLDATLDVLGTLSQKFGVICFSADPLHPLMWAHYANSHKGVLLEFDESDPVFHHDSFLKVDYGVERAEYDPSGPADQKAVEAFAKRKSLDWGYEQEYRLIVDLALAHRETDGKRAKYLFTIEPGLLKSVTVGLRAADHIRNEVLSLARKAPLEHLEVFQIETDKNQFKLHRRKIK